ncbi:MAG TPA: cbb3-type cytochrome oxidase assembly protein CcoS [Phycisphaerales bacterium]|nr:cbb3-type cytochrome oxidase assembly protein CcoS [Phycisphaerales bacterium]
MSVLYIMLPVALLIAGTAIAAFIRAAKEGQFDDLETPALRMLPEDDGAGDPDNPR